MSNARLPIAGSIVGTIHSPRSLAAAMKLREGAVGFFELRLDAFAALPNAGVEIGRLKAAAGALPAPLIVTARHPQEGGAGRLSAARREALFRQFLPHARFIDVELRSAPRMADILAEVRGRGTGVILSHHDFRTTPSLARLRELARRAQSVGCDIFKVATTVSTARAFSVLLDFLTGTTPFRRARGVAPALSVMGMGEFGKISRLALGCAGSVLNYGYLDKLQVPGQWPVQALKERLRELR